MYWAHRINGAIGITAVDSFLSAVSLEDSAECTELVNEHGIDTVQYWLNQFATEFNSSPTSEIIQDIESFLGR